MSLRCLPPFLKHRFSLTPRFSVTRRVICSGIAAISSFMLCFNSDVFLGLEMKTLFLRFIHSAVCLTTGPKLLPNRALHTVRSRASSFNCEYPLLSLSSSSSFLRFLPRLPVTSIPPFIFPSITRCRRQLLHSFSSLPYDRSKASSKSSSPHSAI